MSIEIVTRPKEFSITNEDKGLTIELNTRPVTVEVSNRSVIFQKADTRLSVVANEAERLASNARIGSFILQQDTGTVYFKKSASEFVKTSVVITATQSLDGLMSALDKAKLDALVYGQEENTICEGNDARLSDARAPLSHTQDASTIENDSNLQGETVKEVLDILNEGIDIRDLTITVKTVANLNEFQTGVIDEFPVNDFKFSKWFIHCIDQTNMTKMTSEITAHFDGNNVGFTEALSLGSASIDLYIDHDEGKMRLVATASANNQSIFVLRNSIK